MSAIERIQQLEVEIQTLTDKFFYTGDQKYMTAADTLEDELCDLYTNNRDEINQHIGF